MFSGHLYERTAPVQRLTLAILCSIVYEKGSKKESFEWYNMRKRKEKECKVVAGDKTEEGSKQPTSVPKEHVANGYAKFRQNAQKNGERFMLARMLVDPCHVAHSSLGWEAIWVYHCLSSVGSAWFPPLQQESPDCATVDSAGRLHKHTCGVRLTAVTSPRQGPNAAAVA